MGSVVTSMLKILITNLLAMLVSKKVVIWGLKLAAKQTSNTIDDSVIAVVEAAYDNDVDSFQKEVESLVNSFSKK